MMLSRRRLGLVAMGALAAPAVLRAQEAPARLSVVELFTSQGCSSCPPADALMVELAREPNVVPLTFPVDIWDYLGWRDTLARPEFTSRQRAYAQQVANRRVYTPQAVVNGKAACVGSDFSQILRLRRSTMPEGAVARISIAPDAAGFSAEVDARALDPAARLFVVPIASRVEVAIGKGENSGRKVVYANVARRITDLGTVGGRRHALALSGSDLAAEGADGVAILVQHGTLEKPGPLAGSALATPALRRV